MLERFVALVVTSEASVAFGSEVVVDCSVYCFEMAFEMSLAELMVSLVLGLFVRTLAAVPKTVIVASCVDVSVRYFYFARCRRECVR